VNGTAYDWDANGRLLEDDQWTYSYDHAGRLISAVDSSGAIAYGYNGLDQRIWLEQDGSSRELTLDINRPFEQVLSDGSKDYLYGLGRIGELGGDAWLYALGDHLGSVRQATDHAGKVKLSRDYSPFGVLTDETIFSNSSFGYTAEWSEPTGLIHLRARYYAPEQGRFTTRDPFPGVASSPASLHSYLYVLNNPLLYTDPGGEIGLLAAVAIGALAGATIGGLWNYGTQIYENMTQCGMGFWDAAALRNIDGSRLGMAMLEGALFGAIGALTGGLLAMAEIGGLAAFAYTGFVDIGLGFAWDTTVHGYTPSEAFVSNVLSFGIGAGIGFVAKQASSVFGGRLRSSHAVPTEPYSRPSGATTAAQRAIVQGQPCVECGQIADTQVADHVYPLVKEWYETGDIDLDYMRSLEAIQPMCPTCSARQGGQLSWYSRMMKEVFDLD
jgi:RHS repeat-associated protein